MSSAQRYVENMVHVDMSLVVRSSGMPQAELARRLSDALGRRYDRAAVNKMLKGTRRISEEERAAMLRILNEPKAVGSAPVSAPELVEPTHRITTELVGAADLPVFAAAMGGEGHLIVTFDPVDYVKRPQPLQHVRDGYALLVTGESMVPAFRPGDLALINPRLPPERGQEVILYHTPPNGEAEAMIKTLVSFNDRDWNLEQYNPARQFTEARADWAICHRVVGKYARR